MQGEIPRTTPSSGTPPLVHKPTIHQDTTEGREFAVVLRSVKRKPFLAHRLLLKPIQNLRPLEQPSPFGIEVRMFGLPSVTVVTISAAFVFGMVLALLGSLK